MTSRREAPSRGTQNATPPERTYQVCGAKKHNSEERCQRPAGWGTNHPGTGRCKLHGGCNTGPKDRAKHAQSMQGNKNGRKHGMWEKVVADRLTGADKALFESIPNQKDMMVELKILRFKILRLLDPVERAQVINLGEGMGQEIQMIEVDEATKAYAIERLCDGIRKILRDMKEVDEEHDSFEKLLVQIAAIRSGNAVEHERPEEDEDD